MPLKKRLRDIIIIRLFCILTLYWQTKDIHTHKGKRNFQFHIKIQYLLKDIYLLTSPVCITTWYWCCYAMQYPNQAWSCLTKYQTSVENRQQWQIRQALNTKLDNDQSVLLFCFLLKPMGIIHNSLSDVFYTKTIALHICTVTLSTSPSAN